MVDGRARCNTPQVEPVAEFRSALGGRPQERQVPTDSQRLSRLRELRLPSRFRFRGPVLGIQASMFAALLLALVLTDTERCLSWRSGTR
eukprot:1763797-Rhodomonas_salina.2